MLGATSAEPSCEFERLEQRVLLSTTFPAPAQAPAGLVVESAATVDPLTAAQRAALDDIARGGSGAGWVDLSGPQMRALAAKAELHLANYLDHHLPDGLNADIRWTGFDRTQVHAYNGLGDSATWTGHYMAAQALRYAVTQDTRIIRDIDDALDRIDLLTRVSGTSGFLARHAIPRSALLTPGSPYAAYYRQYGGSTSDPLLGESAHRGAGDLDDYVYLGGTARDTYDAVNFGLATVYKFVNDADVRTRVTRLVERIVDYRVNLFTVLFDNFSTTAMLRTAATVNPGAYESTYAFAAGLLGTGSNVDANFGNYFSNNLDFIRTFVLTQLETDAGRKAKWQTKLTNLWRDAADHLNPHFAAIYMAGTGDLGDTRAVAVLQGVLADFQGPPRFNVRRTNSTRTDIDLVTVDGTRYAKYALPINDRPGSDFMWQRHPFKLDGGTDAPQEQPGIDVFLPYWMGRSLGVFTAAATLPHHEDFDDGVAEFFQVAGGDWEAAGGRYAVTPEPGAAGVSLLALAEPLPSTFVARATLNASAGDGTYQSNAAIIFDYRGPDDFKFAGGFFGADAWRIGHFNGTDWVVDASMGEPMGSGTDYDVAVGIVDSRVSLSVDGVLKATHDFGEPAHGGSLGLGTRRSIARFDDFSVYRATTLAHFEDFDDGAAEFLQVAAGAWDVAGGRYGVKPEPGAAGLSLLALTEPLPASFAAGATVNASAGDGTYWSNALIVFDYRGPDDFKFAGGFSGADAWRIGHVRGAEWVTDAFAEAPIASNVDYRLEIVVVGTEVRLSVDGSPRVTHDFGEPVHGGSLGLGTRRGIARFDDLAVHPLATLPLLETFDGAHAFLAEEGRWDVAAGRYAVRPEPGATALSLLALAEPLPASFTAGATVNATAGDGTYWGNALIIFDYADAANFKFAGGFLGAGEWRLGRVLDGTWHVDARVSRPLAAEHDYRLAVVTGHGRATLRVDGSAVLTHDFAEPLSDGRIGLGTRRAIARFDDVVVEDAAELTPPVVVAVRVGGSAWADAFPAGAEAPVSYPIPLGSAAQTTPLPWHGIDRIELVFSTDVRVDAQDLRLAGVNQPMLDATNFHYDAASLTATWQFAHALETDRMLIRLSDGVRDAFGNALDGEWTDGVSRLSGDGLAGGDFAMQVNVVSGDVDGDGRTAAGDFDRLRNALGSTAGSAAYALFADLNADGRVDGLDVRRFWSSLGSALPPDAAH